MNTQLAIENFLINRQARNLSPQSIQWYNYNLGRFARFCPELPLKPGPIEEFLAGRNVAPETKCSYFKILKAFYRFTRQRNRLPNPMEQIAQPRRPKKIMPTLEAGEIMQLLSSADNLRDRALITLFIDTGARVGEIAGLCKENISEAGIKVNGKTGEREIPISDETRRLLQALIATNGKGGYIFTSRRGRPLDTRGIYYLVHKLMRETGIDKPKLGPTRIRHAFAKTYLMNGGDLRSLQELMGHANISTTQKYASLNLNDIIEKHHKFTPLRSAHAAAQESFLDKSGVLKEAEEILEGGSE